MTRITAEERSHVAAALRALDAAKSSAVAVNARDLAAEVFTAAERQEALGRSANSRQQYLAAATSLDAATTLYKSAERAAHAELEARAARARAEESRRRAEQVETRPEPLPTAPVSQPPAPAPPRPPRPEPAAPAPPPGPSPQEAVSAAVQRYVLALQNRDMPSLKAVWPGLGGQDQAAIQAEFDNARSIDVEFVNPRIDINGTAATVTGVRRYSLRTRDNQQLRKDTLTTLSLRQSGNAWLIESVRHQAR